MEWPFWKWAGSRVARARVKATEDPPVTVRPDALGASPARHPSSSLDIARGKVMRRADLQHPRPDTDLGILPRLAASVCGAPMAIVTLATGAEDRVKDRVGLSVEEAARLAPFYDAIRSVGKTDICLVPDVRTDIRFLPMPGEPPLAEIRFFAGVPLVTEAGVVRGSLCVFDRVVRNLAPAQQDALRGIGAQIMRCLRWDRLVADLEGALAEQRDAEAALRDSIARFRSVVQSAVEGIVLADETGTVISWNRAAERMFGYRPDEVLGVPLTVLMPARYRQAHEAGIARLRQGNQPSLLGKTLDLAGLRKDGTEFPIELSLARGEGAHGVFYTGVIRDVSERRRAEEERERLITELRQALARVKALRGLLPICATCKKIRDDTGYWTRLESYLAEHAEVEITHGLCPECARKIHPDWDDAAQGP